MAKYIDVAIVRCMGCKSCEIACAVSHSSSKDLEALVRDGEKPGYRINVEAYGRNAVPINCKHCEEAACILACPTGAVHRDAPGEPVIVNQERCIGCRMCVQACPFGVITINPNGKGVLKCDMCIERLRIGQKPACVVSCPTKALTFVDEQEATKLKRKKTAMQIIAAHQKTGEVVEG